MTPQEGGRYANSASGLDNKALMGMGRRHMQDYWSHLDQKERGRAQNRSCPLTFPMGQGDGILGTGLRADGHMLD
jgi:hypothetical protein